MLKKVLIVEDSALQVKMYQRVFAMYPGCRQVVSQNGYDAMEKLAVEPDFDLIILDINMPKMNGLAFLKELNRQGKSPVPVIVISTEGKDGDIRRALTLGAAAYLKKPWTPAEIQDIVQRVVASARAREAR